MKRPNKKKEPTGADFPLIPIIGTCAAPVLTAIFMVLHAHHTAKQYEHETALGFPENPFRFK